MFDTKQADDNIPSQAPAQNDDLIPDEVLHSENATPETGEQTIKSDVDDLNQGKEFPFKKIVDTERGQKTVSSPDTPTQKEPVDIFEDQNERPEPLQNNFPGGGAAPESQPLPDNLPDQLAAQENLPRGGKNGNGLFVVLIVFLTVVLLGLLGYWFWVSQIRDKEPVVDPTNNSFPELEQKKELDDILSDLSSDSVGDQDNEDNDPEDFDYEDFENTPEDTPAPVDDQNIDSDEDGLFDYEELIYGTNPNRVDSDFDGLGDQEEIMDYKTDPNNSDSDGDSYPDGIEVKNGYDPLGPGKLK